MAVMKANRIFNNLTAWELELNKKEKEIRREIRKLKLREPDLLEYRLEIESGFLLLTKSIHTLKSNCLECHK